MRTYRIYFIRHGMTQGNFEGRYIGATDSPLCEDGIAQIKKLVDSCDYPTVGKVYSSPLSRCVDTAKLIYPEMNLEIVDNIKEYNFGEFENKQINELLKNEKFNRWIDSEWKENPDGAENMQEFIKRVINGLDYIIMDMMKRKISDAAVVTHGGVIAQLLANCGLPKRKQTDWIVGNGKGYTLLVNASLWGNNKTAEVFTAIPYKEKITNNEDIDE